MSIAVHVRADTAEEALTPIAVQDVLVLVTDTEQVFRVTMNEYGGISVSTPVGTLAVQLDHDAETINLIVADVPRGLPPGETVH